MTLSLSHFISYLSPVSYTVSIALYFILCVCVCVCVCNFIFSFSLSSYICVLIFPNVNIALLRVGAVRFLFFSLFFILSFLPLLDIQSLKQNIEMITFHYIEPATKLKKKKSFLYIHIYTALMLSVFGVCLFVLCVSFFLYFRSL